MTGPLTFKHKLVNPALDGIHSPWFYQVDDPGPQGPGVVWVQPVPDATTPTSFLIQQRNSTDTTWTSSVTLACALRRDPETAGPAGRTVSCAPGGVVPRSAAVYSIT